MKNKFSIILKAALVIGITLAFIMPGSAALTKTHTINTIQPIQTSEPRNVAYSALFEDDFESYDDFVLDFPPWTQYDGDGQPTWGMEGVSWPNAGYVGAYIIFNPYMTDPPIDDDPHSGEKYAACFDATPVDPVNDDWMITPQLTSGDYDFYAAIHCVNHDSFWLGIDDFAINEVEPGIIEISFWAKTGSAQYEPDRFQVGVSTKTNAPGDFVIITEEPYVEPPTSWTEYVYTVELAGAVQPELAIESIAGGFGVSAVIKNTGDADATNVAYTIALEGGLIILGKETTNSIPTIAAGASEAIKAGFILGIGKTTITISASCDEGATASATATGTVLLFFVLGVA